MQLKEFSQNNPLRHLILSTVKRYFWLPLVMLLLTGVGFLGFEILKMGELSHPNSITAQLAFRFAASEVWELFPYGAFLVAVIYGYTMNFFLWILGGVSFDAVWLRWVMLLVGDAVTAFGVACFFHTYMPLQVFELFVAEVADRYRLDLHRVKSSFDISLLVISVSLALLLFGDVTEFDWSAIYYTSFHSLGLGTLVTTLINAPLISLMSRFISRAFNDTARFPALERLLKR